MSDSTRKGDLGYSGFLSKAGLTDEAVKELMRSLSEPTSNDAVDAGFRLVPSPIHGLGMLAVRRVTKGEVFPVCRGAVRYNLARYVNHSDTPSAVTNFDAHGNGWMTMLDDLDEGEEVTMDYNDNMAKSFAASAEISLSCVVA